MTDPEPSEPEFSVTFERVLDEALNSRQIRHALERATGALNREQLRTRTLQARMAIAAAAASSIRTIAKRGL
jgi:hypothetical protein